MLFSTLPDLAGYDFEIVGIVASEFLTINDTVMRELANQAERQGANAVINLQVVRTRESFSTILGTAVRFSK